MGKVKATPIVVVHKSDEGACKEKESKESLRKSEIEQKLAVEKVKKEAATKEIAAKKAVPVVVKKCNPVTALEKYVKKCRHTRSSSPKPRSQTRRSSRRS